MPELNHPAGARGDAAIYGGAHPERLLVDARSDGDFNVESWFPDITHRLVLSRAELEDLVSKAQKALR